MTIIINTYNKKYYVLIYSRYKTTLQNLENITLYNCKTNYFYDGAPGHILTTKDIKVAKKFLTIQQAYASLQEKFNNVFNEEQCQEVKITNEKIDFVFHNINNKTMIVNRFEIYDPVIK